MKISNYVLLVIILLVQGCKRQSELQNENLTNSLNIHLIAYLDTIRQNDQKYRTEMNRVEKQFYGRFTKEYSDLKAKMLKMDSINIIKVYEILDNYGWLSEAEIGEESNMTLFLVIQHAKLSIQEKYLPIVREAVKNKKTKAKYLAYLEDRIALRRGKKQTYGTQFAFDIKANMYYLSPLEDPDNVNKRRKEIGMDSIEESAKRFNIIWNSKKYKKDLHHIEELERANFETFLFRQQ